MNIDLTEDLKVFDELQQTAQFQNRKMIEIYKSIYAKILDGIDAAIAAAAGQQVAALIKGSYEATKLFSQKGRETDSVRFEEVFIGKIDPSAKGLVRAKAASIFTDQNFTVPTTVLLRECRLPFRFEKVRHPLYLHNNEAYDNPCWTIDNFVVSFLSEETLKKIRAARFLEEADPAKAQLFIGDEEVAAFLDKQYSDQERPIVSAILTAEMV